MKKVAITMVLVLAALSCLGVSSCKNLIIRGKVAGTVMTASGAPYGLTTVVLTNTKTGQEAQRENATDSGSFIIDNVDPGEYKVSVLGMGGVDIPLLEPIIFKLGSGMTKNLKIIVASE